MVILEDFYVEQTIKIIKLGLLWQCAKESTRSVKIVALKISNIFSAIKTKLCDWIDSMHELFKEDLYIGQTTKITS